MDDDKRTVCCGENIEESPKKEDVGCCGGTTDEQPEGKLEVSDECGCGCGGEFHDQSLVENPDKPENVADPDFIEDFEKFAHSMGIVSIGYTQLIPEIINTEEPLMYHNAIVLTLEMGKDIIKTAPGPEAQQLNDATYAKLGNITYALSDFLRANGFATQVAHPYGSLVSFSPLGQKAGLGWIGQSGLLITPELGPRQKISAIFTSINNLPIKKSVDHSWIIDYCEKCGKCIKACPEKAMIEKETCCGGKEIEFIQERCIGCSQGCTYCIEECPFDQKEYEHIKSRFDKMNAKLKEKQNLKLNYGNNWVEQASPLFAGLVDGAIIAISMIQNEERIVLLEKQDNDLNVSIKNPQELERPVADLMFMAAEKDIKELLNDATSVKFIDLLHSRKIKVFGLINQLQLIKKEYMPFLSRLGLKFGGRGSCCG